MPLQATSGAASYDAFGGGVAAVPNYIEEVFSTYLYTGTGATQTITNGIGLGDTVTSFSYADSGPNSIATTLTGGVAGAATSPFAGVQVSANFPIPTCAINLAANASLNLSGNFTIEGWFYQTDTTAKVVIGSNYSPGGINNQIQFNDSNVPGQVLLYHPSTGALYVNCSSSPLNTWFHLAFVRSGTTFTVYLNGVSQGTVTTSQTYQFTSGAVGALAGYYLGGWVGDISCFRVVNGTAVYTGNFTPSTTPLTAITNTALLLQLNGTGVAGKGGLVWIKSRSAATNHNLFDTLQGVAKATISNASTATVSVPNSLTAFQTTGFTLGVGNTTGYQVNVNAATYASWTFREQSKFFDVVTWTGSGANRTISHNLGSVPGCIMVKRTDVAGDWQVYHQSLANTEYMVLNSTAAKATGATRWNSTTPTSTVFSLGTDATVNASGGTYVAYIYASNAGGFGLTGTDNVISCGSYVGNATLGQAITLGYEPQWLMVKNVSAAGYGWLMLDNMRGMPVSGNSNYFLANDSLAENGAGSAAFFGPTATGFQVTRANDPYTNVSGQTYIYIAIRRGPMKVPTSGTSVFALSAWTGSGGAKDLGSQTNGFGTGYLSMLKSRTSGQDWGQFDQLRGSTPFLVSDSVAAEYIDNGGNGGISVVNNRLQLNNLSFFGSGGDGTGQNYIGQIFRRAPGFFDEACWTGTGSYPFNINHNLGVVPELMIIKTRNFADSWYVYVQPITSPQSNWYQNFLVLNGTVAASSDTTSLTTSPTSTTIPVSAYFGVSTRTYVAYLFATCPGVSKVGSYTGTGTTQQINCGFAAGSRFVLIKRTDSTGDWYVWDSTRGIVAGNDPYLLLNSAAAEVTSTDYVDTYSAGFEISSTAPAAINASGGKFIFLAIA